MPRLTRWFARAALLHLAAGVLLGGLILSAKGMPAALGWAWYTLPAHIQLLVGGWLIQLTLGMAYWILPRLDAAGDRGRPRLAWASFGMLNSGVLAAAIALLVRPLLLAPWLDALLVAAAVLQVGALAAFVGHAWPRVRPAGLPVVARSRQPEPH